MRRPVVASCAALCAVAIVAGASRAGAQQSTQSRDSARADSARAPRPLDAVVVTASRRLQRVSDAPVTTEVISRAEIERSGAQDLNSLLTQYVGVQSEPSVAGSGGVQIEGLSSQHVLLLIDGQPMVGRIDGELDVSRVPAWMIDHIEVIKGPSSTLYGSSAMGGVINVITKDAYRTRPVMNASATGGSQGRVDANAAMLGGAGNLRGMFGVGRRQDEVQPGRSDQSGAQSNRWDANGKLRWMPGSSSLQIDGALFGVREDQRWQSGQLYNFSNNSQLDMRSGMVLPLTTDDNNRLGATLYYSRFDHLSRQSTLPQPATDSGDASTESLARAEVTFTGGMVPSQTLDAGVDFDRDALAATRIVGGHRTSTTAEPFAQYTMDFGRLSVVPGARMSYSDQWGTHFTPKLATLYHLGGGVSLRASASAGYRAPEFKELYITFLNSNVGYVVHGNPELVPETSTNVTGAVDWTGARGYLRVQGYTNRFSQFIESVELPDSGGVEQFTYGNIAHGMTRGVDVDGGVSVGILNLDGSYGYLEAIDRSTGLPLLGATPRSARLTADARLWSGFRPSMTLLYWSATPASTTGIGSNVTTLDRAAFTRVDARLARAFTGGIEAQVGVMNAFGATPKLWPGNTARQWYVGLRVDRGL